MPNKELVLSWLAENAPAMYAAFLSAVIAVLRVAYNGGTLRQKFFEGMLCGTLTLATISGMSLFGLPVTAAGFVGGWLGFLGVDRARALADRFLSKKADGDPE